jgi:3',5'-cyclic AMP phosphodiesterase CpdA
MARRGLWTALAAAIAALAGAPAGAEDLRFAVFGDCQPPEKDMRYAPALPILAQDMAGQKVSFVIGVGDYVRGGGGLDEMRRQYQGFFAGLAPLQARGPVPVALSPGNHDIQGSRDRARFFASTLRPLPYSFNRAGCHFVILDTEQPGLSSRIAGAQLRWLKQDLAASRRAALTFVAGHEPLFPVSIHRGESLDRYRAERDALHRLFVSEGVDCVLSGHEHLFHREQRGGVDYIITGGGGGPPYASPARGGYHHYVLVTATGSAYNVRVRKLTE